MKNKSEKNILPIFKNIKNGITFFKKIKKAVSKKTAFFISRDIFEKWKDWNGNILKYIQDNSF